MKPSTAKYCQECLRDFIENEKVFYAFSENGSFCEECSSKLNILDFEQRKVICTTSIIEQTNEVKVKAKTIAQYSITVTSSLSPVDFMNKYSHLSNTTIKAINSNGESELFELLDSEVTKIEWLDEEKQYSFNEQVVKIE